LITLAPGVYFSFKQPFHPRQLSRFWLEKVHRYLRNLSSFCMTFSFNFCTGKLREKVWRSSQFTFCSIFQVTKNRPQFQGYRKDCLWNWPWKFFKIHFLLVKKINKSFFNNCREPIAVVKDCENLGSFDKIILNQKWQFYNLENLRVDWQI
jgi:hypothetical protein